MWGYFYKNLSENTDRTTQANQIENCHFDSNSEDMFFC